MIIKSTPGGFFRNFFSPSTPRYGCFSQKKP